MSARKRHCLVEIQTKTLVHIIANMSIKECVKDVRTFTYKQN